MSTSSVYVCSDLQHLHFTIACSWQTFVDDIMKTLWSSRHWRQRISVYFSNQAVWVPSYSSIRKPFLTFWTSRDTARQRLSSLTVVTELIELVTTVDSLSDSRAVNTLKKQPQLQPSQSYEQLIPCQPAWHGSFLATASRGTSEGFLGAF